MTKVFSSWMASQATIKRICRRFASHGVDGRLRLTDLNKLTIDAKYAVRGSIPIRADELRKKLESKLATLPFDEIINANIGNPQQLNQKPLTWYRQVLAILQYPPLLQESKLFPSDVVERATNLLNSLGSLGAYSHSQGDALVRQSVAKFIEQRDGYPSEPDNIFLTNGASSAVGYLLQLLSKGISTGFLIPIPQYPLYTATIALNNTKPIGYYLDEENGWATNPREIEELIHREQKDGIDVKTLIIINPGNPTGSILSYDNIVNIVDIAAEHNIVIIADEVYQENIFEGKFISIKMVLSDLVAENPERYANVQLASLHSTSKGISGECGQRGGYMELVGFIPEVRDIIFKLASINLCSAVSGQALTELMINPPKKGDPSYEIYNKEITSIHGDLWSRAEHLYKAFQEMTDVICQKPLGAMYLFPKLDFTKATYKKLFEAAEEKDMEVDEYYCMELLENTGICCVPGSGFGQKSGTYHIRTTFLAEGTTWVRKWNDFHTKFVQKYKDA